MSRFRKWLTLTIAILVILTIILGGLCGCVPDALVDYQTDGGSDGPLVPITGGPDDFSLKDGSWFDANMPRAPPGLGERFDPSGNPFASSFSDAKDIRTATFVIAAADSKHYFDVDYRCNGTNDQVQIQAAHDALPAAGGKIVLLEGIFNVSAEIDITKESVAIHGIGMSFGEGHQTGTVLLVQAGFTGDYVFHWDVSNFGEVRGLAIDGDGVGKHGIHVNTRDFIIENVSITSCARGVYGTRGDIWIMNCLFELNTSQGIRFNGNNSSWITNNVFWDNVDDIYLEGTISEMFLINNRTADSTYFCRTSGGTCHMMLAMGNIHDEVVNAPYYFRSSGNIDRLTILADICNGNSVTTHFIWAESAGTVVNSQVKDCIITGLTGAVFHNIPDINNIIHTRQHSDPFVDVLASSANLIVNAQNFVNGAIALTGSQPKYPRGLVFAITAGVTDYTLTVVGTNSKGEAITEIFTFAADGLAFSSDNAFDNVASITLADRAGAAATIDVGIDERLGLMNVIYETADVWKIIKNGAKQVVAVAQVDVTYDIYDMSVITLALNDDFDIWYRAPLNIIK